MTDEPRNGHDVTDLLAVGLAERRRLLEESRARLDAFNDPRHPPQPGPDSVLPPAWGEPVPDPVERDRRLSLGAALAIGFIAGAFLVGLVVLGWLGRLR